VFKEQSRHRQRVTAVLDSTVTVLAFIGAYFLREVWIGKLPPFASYVAWLPVVIALWLGLLVACGCYRDPRDPSFRRIALPVVNAIATGVALLLVVLFVLKLHHFSRVFVFTFGVLDAAGLIAIRLAFRWRLRRLPRRHENLYRILIAGTGPRGRRVAHALLQHADWGYRIVGFIDSEPERVAGIRLPAPVLGTVSEITGILKDNVVDEVILAIPRRMLSEMEKIVRACEEEGIRVRLQADLFQVPIRRLTLDEFLGIPLLTFHAVAHEEWKLLAKRTIDLASASLSLVILAPFMVIIALAIRLDSPGPVFFVQRRVGLNKRIFWLVKFRTMYADAEQRQKELEPLNQADGPVFKIFDDPRVTRVGRFLRRTSLDEIPQLANVALGHMSLVGPRPLPLRDVSLFDRGEQRRRFSVKPGLTCLWVIAGRSALSFADWLRLDLWYIDNWSITLDLKILIRTVPVVFRGTGAA
jgi:exopolysaccharide biosynthesis polyprenyl glycosylphosphotransferase